VKAVLNSEVGFTSQAYGAMDQYVAAPPPSARHLLQDETEEMYTTLLEEIRTLSSQQKALENQVRDALRPVPKPRPRVGELVVACASAARFTYGFSASHAAPRERRGGDRMA
jgi:hypothetical protein